MEQAINQMLVLDYLIQNEDRHQNNFGVVRRADTLELSALDGIEEELREIVCDSLFIEEARCEALCRGIRQRIKQLEQILPELSKDSL